MPSGNELLPTIVANLHASGLIPPVKSVEAVGAGVIRVTVVGAATQDLRDRLTTVMGSTRWNLVEASDDQAAGVSLR